MKVIIVGGSGFIGSVLTRRLLADGHQVTIYDLVEPEQASQAEFVQGDIRHLEDLSRAMRGHEVVVNLAAEHQDDVVPISKYDSVNVVGARVLCASMVENGITSLVFTSSVAVYGTQPAAITEDCEHNFFNDYGRTKHEAEGVYTAWQSADPARRLTIIRPTVVFGPGNRGNVYNLLKQIKSGRFLMVGDGTNKKSIAYVENVAGFICYLTSTATPGLRIFNYADKPDLTMNELVQRVRVQLGRGDRPAPRLPTAAGLFIGSCADVLSRLTGKKLPISTVRVRKFCMNSEIDASRAAASGFTPPVNVWQGLDDMVRNHV